MDPRSRSGAEQQFSVLALAACASKLSFSSGVLLPTLCPGKIQHDLSHGSVISKSRRPVRPVARSALSYARSAQYQSRFEGTAPIRKDGALV